MNLTLPHLLGTYKGKKYSRYTVHVRQSGLNRTYWERHGDLEIIARSPAEACNAIKDEIAPRVDDPTEFFCAGPKGGVTSRFVGWESLIWAKMCAQRSELVQTVLKLDNGLQDGVQ
jgi:hypothetical protein